MSTAAISSVNANLVPTPFDEASDALRQSATELDAVQEQFLDSAGVRGRQSREHLRQGVAHLEGGLINASLAATLTGRAAIRAGTGVALGTAGVGSAIGAGAVRIAEAPADGVYWGAYAGCNAFAGVANAAARINRQPRVSCSRDGDNPNVKRLSTLLWEAKDGLFDKASAEFAAAGQDLRAAGPHLVGAAINGYMSGANFIMAAVRAGQAAGDLTAAAAVEVGEVGLLVLAEGMQAAEAGVDAARTLGILGALMMAGVANSTKLDHGAVNVHEQSWIALIESLKAEQPELFDTYPQLEAAYQEAMRLSGN